MSTFEERKELVEGLRAQWKSMWQERVDDKERAEGISFRDYSQLFIERGTVIMATRKFKQLDFYEILEQYKKLVGGEAIPPHPSVGGWGKFIRGNFKPNTQVRRRRSAPEPVKKEKQQLKKSGRGWLHYK